ncbi:hypothetical protein GCM10023171_22530 [Microbacterium panaciterrae]|uniref:Uncharacterized protein n=1 Tax=Microbacterium panaciterrae TaxID=985759 RepID=A0ABP8PI47_9MICO
MRVQERADPGGHSVAPGDGERAPFGEVVLHVDDQQRASHDPSVRRNGETPSEEGVFSGAAQGIRTMIAGLTWRYSTELSGTGRHVNPASGLTAIRPAA